MCADQGQLELAWAAAVFESEGSLTAKRQNGRVYLRASVSQNGGEEARAFLQRFIDAVGLGTLRGPYDYAGRYANSPGKKPRNVVAIQSQAGVDELMVRLGPYITPGSEKVAKYRRLKEEQEAAH